MKWLQGLTVRRAVTLFVVLAAAGSLVNGALTLEQGRDSEQLAARLLVGLNQVAAGGTADMMHDALRGDVQAAQLAGAKAAEKERKAILDGLAEHRQTIGDALAQLERSANDDALRAAVAAAKPAVQVYADAAEKLVQAAFTEAGVDAKLSASFDAGFNALERELSALTGLVKKSTERMVDESANQFRQARMTAMTTLAVSLVLLVLFGVAFVRSLLGRLGAEPSRAAMLLQGVAQGDLSTHIELKPGDTASLMAHLKAMLESLSRVVGTVRQNADGVATASAQIAQGNQDLSQRTEQQASALQQTAATMHQLSSTVRHNADNTRQANQLALGAAEVAVKGGAVVEQVVETMRGINDSSKRIADIISVIDGIAFQTNILALNAAVEAARAGEQGRGFAVVAGEVRTLAQRSAAAAKEIRTLIAASVERVEQGTTLVDQAGSTMREVVTSIKRVTDLMGEISSATDEQSTGVAQIGQAVMQMDQATQQNAALVEESAAAAESLRQQALALVDVVAVFRLDAGAGRPALPLLTAS